MTRSSLKSPEKNKESNSSSKEELAATPAGKVGRRRGKKDYVDDEMQVDENDHYHDDQDEQEYQVDGDVEEDEADEAGEETGQAQTESETIAPAPRKRGRPPGSGKKNLVKKGPKRKEDGEFDEDAPSDPEDIDEVGDEKINKDGYLLGGREYRFQTFTLPRHPSRLYLYSLDACKLLGFRDTYIFFLRNENVRRVNGTEKDREHLSRLNILPPQLRNRPITLVRARNLFKVFGHKVVRRGRPVRDDYFCAGMEEPVGGAAGEEVPLGGGGEDDVSYGIFDYTKIPSVLEGGPFRRHGISIAGFATSQYPTSDPEEDPDAPFEPTGPAPASLVADSWMYKCALSAADFNSRLRKHRPVSFLDLHTNVEQIAGGTQPTRVAVEMAVGKDLIKDENGASDLKENGDGKLVLENEVTCNAYPVVEPDWARVSTSDDPIEFPIALLKGQYQDSISVFPFRFQEGDEGIVMGAVREPLPAGVETRQVHDLPPTLMGAIPYKPELAITTVTIRKRGRPKKNGGAEEDERLCAHCHDTEPPETNQVSSIPRSVSLTCARCSSKNHPICIDFKDSPTLVAKCMSYPWTCSNCKMCVICQTSTQDERLLFCDLCDRASHIFCLVPPLENLPTGEWLCPQCAVCHSCKSTTAKHYNHVLLSGDEPESTSGSMTPKKLGTFLCSYCDECHEKFENQEYCAICCVTYERDGVDPLVCCEKCERWVHVGCDPILTMDRFQDMVASTRPKFTCVLCEPKRRDRFLAGCDDRDVNLVQHGGQWLYAPPLKLLK